VRHHSVRTVFRTFVRRYIYGAHTDVVVRIPLAGAPAPDHVGEFVFRLANPADLERLDELDRYGRGSIQRAHVRDDGDWLFVACHGPRIVATRRYSPRVPPRGLMSRVVRLAEDQIWLSDAFCLPEYRAQGLNRQFGFYTMRFMASLGYRDCLGTIAITNVPSLRSAANRAGQEPLYYVTYVRILFHERLRVSRQIPDVTRGWLRREGPVRRAP
jgi:hypothetical protein